MYRTGDETSRLLSYLLSIYELTFGFIAVGGEISVHNSSAHSLVKGGMAFFLAALGFHLFVNIQKVDDDEFERKRSKLWLGIILLFCSIIASGYISPDALTSHLFFVLFLLYIVLTFLFLGAARNIFGAGVVVYGLIRLTGVTCGAVIAGKFTAASVEPRLFYMIGTYILFHMICEFLRRSASVKGSRFAILGGFLLMLLMITIIFYYFSNTLETISSKLMVLAFFMLLLGLVSYPPLMAIRTMKAANLLSIFPQGLAGGIVLTLTFYIVLGKDLRLILLVLLPVAIIVISYRFGSYKVDNEHETEE